MNKQNYFFNKIINKKFRVRSIFAIYGLINNFFWKNKLGPIIVFIFPFLVVILCYIIDSSNDDTYHYFANNQTLIIPISATPISLFVMPLLLVEIKKSILLKKIAQARIKPIEYILVTGSYFAILSFVSVIIAETFWLIFMNVHLIKYFNINDASSVFYSILCLVITTNAFGLIIGCTLKTTNPIPILGIVIIFLSFILSGIIVPPSYLANTAAIKYINLFSPLNYPLMLINQTYTQLTPSNNCVFDITNSFELFTRKFAFNNPSNFWQFLIDYLKPVKSIVWYLPWQRITALIGPWIVVFFFNLISTKYFSWSSR